MKYKLVKENLNEVIFFTRSGDPLSTLDIGRKSLIEKWLNEMYISSYKINKNLTIDVFQDIWIVYKILHKLPEYIQFNKVYGNVTFYKSGLESLKGFPNFIKVYFVCADNKLTSLKYCPKLIKGDFHCDNNKIKFTKENIKKVCKVKGKIKN